MLDIATMRVVFALIGVTMLILFGSTYRATRAPVSGWWCLALGLFLVASLLWLANGTPWQAVANPLGNVTSVTGAVAVWMGARSNRGVRPRWFVLLPLPLLIGVVAALDHPDQTIWPGGALYLMAMTMNFALASFDLWLSRRATRMQGLGLSPITTTLASVSTIVTLFYLARTCVYVALGPESDLFTTVFGGVPNTLLMIVMVLAASHTMGALSHEQLVFDLRRSAAYDDLTGLLHRGAFFQLAARELRRVQQAAVVVADLDHFKQINDTYGHTCGDDVLSRFADAVREATRSTDLHARFGGEEFLILMPGANVHAAQVAVETINRELRAHNPVPGAEVSASFGIAAVGPGIGLDAAIAHADAALYQAKDEGRGRSVIYAPSPRVTTPEGDGGIRPPLPRSEQQPTPAPRRVPVPPPASPRPAGPSDSSGAAG